MSGTAKTGALLLCACAAVRPVSALAQQDTSRAPEGVRVGITYAPGTRPGVSIIALTGAVAAESVKTIVSRDLDESDRFEMITPPDTVARSGAPNLAVLNAIGSQWAVSVQASGASVAVQLVDVKSGAVRFRRDVPVGPDAVPDRMAVHHASDEIVRAATGTPGIAATKILFVRGERIWEIDEDGTAPTELRTTGFPALSPAWTPDGRRMAYTAYVEAGVPLVIQDLSAGGRQLVPGTEYGLNITPEFSRDGRHLAFAKGTDRGTDIYTWDVGSSTPPQRITTGRGFADNLSPTWSPDGGRIAFVSTRGGSPQIYLMSSDGTDQDVLARFDYGATGPSNAPSWSPAGQFVAFHREVGGVPQLFLVDLATRSVRQLTGTARNEDCNWAPDGRHLVFVSNRTGARELWIMDIETGRVRQLTHLPGAALPSWSPLLGVAQ